MVEEGGVEPPYIPATSILPGNVARLVVNPDSFYPLKTKLMTNIKYFFAQNAYLCTQIHVSLINYINYGYIYCYLRNCTEC